jgi:hypothetical protein
MALTIHQKLASIVEEIDRKGFAELVRLTVLKKWFEPPGRHRAFALWIAGRAAHIDEPASEAEASLLAEARAFLADIQSHGELNPPRMRQFQERLTAFQPDYTQLTWGPVRVVHSKRLMMIEDALAICLWHPDDPRYGYRLAAYYCEHYDARHGNNLNGPSRDRVLEIASFVARREVDEVACRYGESTRGQP